MTRLTKEFLRLLREDEAFREEVRRQVLTDDLLAVSGRLDRLETLLQRTLEMVQQTLELQRQTLETVRTMAAAMAEFAAHVDRRFDRLEQDVEGLKQDVRGLKQDVGGLKQDMEGLKQDVRGLKQDVGDLKGKSLEAEWRAKAPAFLGRRFRRVRVFSLEALADLAAFGLDQGVFSEAEADEIRLADVVAEALDSQGAPVRVVVEVSWTVGLEDVERARRRADLLARLGVPTVPVAAGEAVSQAARAEAERAGVWLLTDGRWVE
ncbi:MAG: hypothetical protein NZ742_07360 [Acidobacteria bacterium]|nr:hypothetical protein [Acidobacteriota bacterium]MDW7983473.1 hypothetical protein [Acidobacteriota bacterium]